MPKLVLVCLPLFALYTRFLFRRAGQVYLQHLVVALHFHTFIYLWLMFRDGWVFLLGLPGLGLGDWLHFAANCWMFVYPFLMLKHLFGGSWPGAIARSALALVVYALTLGVVFAGTVVLILWWE